MLALFISSFVTLFVVLDPPGCVPIFSSLTNGASVAHRLPCGVAATAILVPPMLYDHEAAPLDRDLLRVLGDLAHLLKRAIAGRTCALVVREPVMLDRKSVV